MALANTLKKNIKGDEAAVVYNKHIEGSASHRKDLTLLLQRMGSHSFLGGIWLDLSYVIENSL